MLLAAALTNLPFLPQMATVTLGADEVFGPFALSLPARAANANQMPPDPQQQEDSTMHANNADEELIQLANRISQERPGLSLRDATMEAGHRRPALVFER